MNTRANGNRSAGERALDRYASEFLRGCAADLDVNALLPRDEDGGSVELFELAALDEAVRIARLLPSDAREVRLRYLKQVSAIGNRRRLAQALRQQAIEDLRARFPHCGGVLESVARNSALSALCPTAIARLPPILLLGEGGVGKTALARAIAKALGLPIVEIAMGGVSSGFILAGLDVGYSTGKPGRVFETLALGEYANPLILLDELDKAGSGDRYPVTSTLYALLEPLTRTVLRRRGGAVEDRWVARPLVRDRELRGGHRTGLALAFRRVRDSRSRLGAGGSDCAVHVRRHHCRRTLGIPVSAVAGRRGTATNHGFTAA